VVKEGSCGIVNRDVQTSGGGCGGVGAEEVEGGVGGEEGP
jgi:hypothetical protein